MDVWFGQVKGTIITSSEFAIEVRVPAQAKLNTIEVINKTSFLSAKANLKFMPSFSGEAFNVSKFNTVLVEGVNKFSASEELWDMSTSDLNLDGKPDIVTTKFQSSVPFATSTDIMILQNTSTPGNIDFDRLEKNNLAVLNLTFPTDNVVTGDLNGDGKPEIIVSRAGSTRNSIHIFRNTSPAGGAISFAAPVTTLALETGHVATRMALRDLNKDGKPEITVSNSFNEVVYIFVNQSSGGTLSFNTTPLKLSVRVFASDPSSTNYEVEVQDFNGDDLPDLVVNEFQEDSLHVFRNTSVGSITFAPKVTIPTTEKLNRLSSVDVNKDGKLDLITSSTLNNQLLVFLNQSTGTPIVFASSPMVLNTATGAWGVDVSDIDGDNDPDIINANRNQNQINIFTHNGNFSTPAYTRNDITTTNPTRNVKVADMDGDGKPDIIYTSFNSSGTPTSSVEILRNTNCHQPRILNEQPLVVCNGRVVKLETYAANNVIFTWTKDSAPVGTNSPFLTISAPGNAAGTYTVTATGEGGTCMVTTAPLTVTEDTGAAPANPDITANTPLCTGAQLQLATSVTADSYAWTGPNNFTSALQNPTINTVTQDHSGVYYLQVTVSGCKSNVVSIRVDIADLADFAISSNNPTNTICQGGNLILSVSNLANHTYQWKKDGVNITTGGTSANLTVTTEGNYSVDVTNTTLSCNKVVGPVAVTVLQVPVAAYQVDASACTGETITFTNQSTVDSRATVVYNWNFGDTNSSQDTNPTKSYATANTFNTTLTVSYSGVSGCSNNTSKSITVVATVQPVISSTAASLCPDEAATLSISGTFPSILWSTSGTANSTTVTGPATYSVTTTDANGCPGQDDIIIDAKPVPVVTAEANPLTIPLGATSQLLAEGADTYSWVPVETLDNPAIANPVATPLITTAYTVTGSITNGCSAEAEITVTVEGVLGFPVVFSPNGDGFNDEWNIRAQDKPECTLSIFDSKGRRISETKGQNWDGTYQGNAVPNGTYYYVFGCPAEKPVTGNVLIIR